MSYPKIFSLDNPDFGNVTPEDLKDEMLWRLVLCYAQTNETTADALRAAWRDYGALRERIRDLMQSFPRGD